MKLKNTIRVLLLERDADMLIRLLTFLELRPDIEIIEADQSLPIIMDETASVSKLRSLMNLLHPDVAVVDLREPLERDLVWIARMQEIMAVPLIAFTDVALSNKMIKGVKLFDIVQRPTDNNENTVLNTLRLLAFAIRRTNIKSQGQHEDQKFPDRSGQYFCGDTELIAIGASAGGTEAIKNIVSALPADMPPILVVQHITRGFIESFAGHINKRGCLSAEVARDGVMVRPGCIYVAPDSMHLTIEKRRKGYFLRCIEGERISGHLPSIDVLFDSVAKEVGAGAVGVLLTGMGKDGAAGLFHMRQAGALTIGQDKGTSLIYGMPRAAYELGAVMLQLPLDKIGSELVKHIFKGEVCNGKNSYSR